MGEWLRWGLPISEQSGEYLTYDQYCQACAADGIRPVGIQRFRSLMDARGLRIAPQDEARPKAGHTRTVTAE